MHTGEKDRLRIVFVCQYFPPEMGAPAARTFEHARHWAAQGHDVTVVCGLPNHPDGIVPPAYRGRWLIREEVEGVRVLRCWLYATPNRGVIRRSLAFLTFMLSAVFFGTWFTRPCDVVIGTSPQMLCAVAARLVAFFKWKPFVLEVRDVWPQQIIDLGVIRNPLLIAALRAMEAWMYRAARTIVVVAEATRQQLLQRGLPEGKVVTITNGIDPDLFRPVDPRPLRSAWGLEGKVVVLYTGTHGLSQGLDTVLDAAGRLRDRSEIVFLFVGAGCERDALIRSAEASGLTNVRFESAVPKQDMPALYAVADLCLVPLKKREVFLYNIPSKMFEIMACARPIILGVGGQARDLLIEAGAGLAIEPEDPKALAEAICQLAAEPGVRTQFGQIGQRHVTRHYVRRQRAQQYLQCLRRVVGQASPAEDTVGKPAGPSRSRVERKAAS